MSPWDGGNCGLVPFVSSLAPTLIFKLSHGKKLMRLCLLCAGEAEKLVWIYLSSLFSEVHVDFLLSTESVGWGALCPVAAWRMIPKGEGAKVVLDFPLYLWGFGCMSGPVWVFGSFMGRGRRRMISVSCFWWRAQAVLCFWGLLLLILLPILVQVSSLRRTTEWLNLEGISTAPQSKPLLKQTHPWVRWEPCPVAFQSSPQFLNSWSLQSFSACVWCFL